MEWFSQGIRRSLPFDPAYVDFHSAVKSSVAVLLLVVNSELLVADDTSSPFSSSSNTNDGRFDMRFGTTPIILGYHLE